MRLLTCIFAIGLANAEIRIGLIGDQTSVDDLDASYKVLAEGVAALNTRRPDVVLHTGDLLESVRFPSATPEEEFRAQFAKATAILNQLKAPWHLSPGDHDVKRPTTSRTRLTIVRSFKVSTPRRKSIFTSASIMPAITSLLSARRTFTTLIRAGAQRSAHASPTRR